MDSDSSRGTVFIFAKKSETKGSGSVQLLVHLT